MLLKKACSIFQIHSPNNFHFPEVELELNMANMTATKVWEYRHDPDHISPTISGVQRLENGNTLVNFGRRPVTLVEVDERGQGIWILADTSDSMTYLRRYRSETIESIGGEFSVLNCSPDGC